MVPAIWANSTYPVVCEIKRDDVSSGKIMKVSQINYTCKKNTISLLNTHRGEIFKPFELVIYDDNVIKKSN